jgi:phosphopantothenoylcysteine decarboxylase/phosphopantothenate--cysteine ligase
MGIAIADEAHSRGYEVILISTVPISRDYRVILVETVAQMSSAVTEYVDSSDIVIMTAAVSDYTPVSVAQNKIKKGHESDDLVIKLKKTTDILASIYQNKVSNDIDQLVVGFSAESEDLLSNARKKLYKADIIIANQINLPDSGFGSDYNEVYILQNGAEDLHIPRSPKARIAAGILDYLASSSRHTLRKSSS